MWKILSALLLGVFTGLIVYVSGERLHGWYETGQLAMHRKFAVGPDVVTYAGDPVGFSIEFCLNLFLIVMGSYGVLVACGHLVFEVSGSQLGSLSFSRSANKLVSIIIGLMAGFVLIALTFGLLQRFG